MPLAHAIDSEIEEKKLTFIEHSHVEEDDDRISINLSKVTKEDVEAANAMKNAPGDLLNRLEAFALYFNSGIAAELPAFLTVGCAYCDVLKRMLPFMASLSDDDPSFENAKALYVRWEKRRHSIRLMKQRREIDIALKKSKSPIVPHIGS